jgi:hypothetical protein
MLKKLLDPLASNINDSLARDAVLHPFTWMWCFCKKVMFSPMKTLRGRHFSLKQQTQFTMLSTVLDSLASNINDFLRRAAVFFHSLERGYFAQSWFPHPWKCREGRQYSFQKLTQFTMFSKVLDPLAFNIYDSLTRATVLLPFTWMGWCCKKMKFSPIKRLRGWQYGFQQLTQFTMLTRC